MKEIEWTFMDLKILKRNYEDLKELEMQDLKKCDIRQKTDRVPKRHVSLKISCNLKSYWGFLGY